MGKFSHSSGSSGDATWLDLGQLADRVLKCMAAGDKPPVDCSKAPRPDTGNNARNDAGKDAGKTKGGNRPPEISLEDAVEQLPAEERRQLDKALGQVAGSAKGKGGKHSKSGKRPGTPKRS